MKFLNYDRVLCLSPHPDDVEYGMLGTIMKYKDTKFDIVVLSQGGDFDKSTAKLRQDECNKVWEHIDNLDGQFVKGVKFIKDKSEDEWINFLETSYDIDDYDCILSTSSDDSHFEHKIISNKEEIDKIMKQYLLKNKFQLPLILNTDPICKYLNIPQNSIVKITRPSITSGEYILYRYVA